ncbi:VCBS repeat-containing protein [bacterium]|nr:VCBS repeat-containing protein [bacterium]
MRDPIETRTTDLRPLSFILVIIFSSFLRTAIALDIPERPDPSWSYPPTNAIPAWDHNLGGPTITFLDANGDGFDDLLLGFTGLRWERGDSYDLSGTILIFYADKDGLPLEPDQYIQRNDSYSFASRIQSGGDVNGDGFEDLLIHDPLWHRVMIGAYGRYFIHHGSPTGLNLDSDAILDGDYDTRHDFAYAIASNIDVNDDEYSDLILPRRIWNDTLELDDDTYVVDIYLSDQSGIPFELPSQSRSYYNSYIAATPSLGDINSDGYDDFANCVYYYDTDELLVEIFHGTSFPDEIVPHSIIAANTPDFPVWYNIGRAGDVNGDGYDDIWGFNDEEVYIFFGSDTGLTPIVAQLLPRPTPPPGPGVIAAKRLGDVNGDGYDDIMVSADGLVIYIYFGTDLGLDTGSYWQYDQYDFTYSAISSVGYGLGGEDNDIRNDGYSDFGWTAQNFYDAGAYELQAHVFYLPNITTTTTTTIPGSSTSATTSTTSTTQRNIPDDDDNSYLNDDGANVENVSDETRNSCCGS